MKRQFYWKLCMAVLIACTVGCIAAMFVYHGFYGQIITADAVILGLTVALLLVVVAFLISLPFSKELFTETNEDFIEENPQFQEKQEQKQEKLPSNEEASSQPEADVLRRLSELYQERNTVNEIIDNMAQGFVLISESGKILAVNPSAIKYLTAEDKDYSDENIISLIKDRLLLTSVAKSMNGYSLSGRLDSSEHLCRYFLNPVINKGRIIGTTLFLLDVADTNDVSNLSSAL